MIKKNPTNKSPGPDGLTGEFYEIFRKEYLFFWNYFKKLQRKEYSQIHSMRPQWPWYQNQTKISHKKRELQANITDEHRHKNPHQNTSKLNVKGREVAQPCPTLFDPIDCSPPGSSVHGILQARVLEWVAIFFSKQTEYNSTLKGSFTMIKWDLSQGCKDFLISANQSVWYIPH